MQMRLRLALPVIGLLLFAAGSYYSFRRNRGFHNPQYFYWASIQLNSDPLGKHTPTSEPCRNGKPDCVGWDPEYVWTDPGPVAKLLVFSALPAFLLGAGIVHPLARLGVNEVATFMISMPILL